MDEHTVLFILLLFLLSFRMCRIHYSFIHAQAHARDHAFNLFTVQNLTHAPYFQFFFIIALLYIERVTTRTGHKVYKQETVAGLSAL